MSPVRRETKQDRKRRAERLQETTSPVTGEVPALRICKPCRRKAHVHAKGRNGCQCAYPGHPDKEKE